MQAVDEFCQGLSEYIDDPVRFRMSLLPTKKQEGASVVYVLTFILILFDDFCGFQ